MPQPLFELLIEALLGLVAGLLGGMLGIGGSVIMIPGLAVLFGRSDPNTQHLYQAAAMGVNVAVSFPAAIRHWREGAMMTALLRIVLPSALAAIVVGVLVSNMIPGQTLRYAFAAFLVYVAITSAIKAVRRTPDHTRELARITLPRGVAVGVVLGFAAGVLGIGGGILAVPLAQALCRVPLRSAIAVSSASMCITAGIGATIKVATLPRWGFEPTEAIMLIATMAPTALIGGWFGAKLTHRLPLGAVRAVMLALLLLAAWRMASPPSNHANAQPPTPPPPAMSE